VFETEFGVELDDHPSVSLFMDTLLTVLFDLQSTDRKHHRKDATEVLCWKERDDSCCRASND